jgi:hypothetical protein
MNGYSRVVTLITNLLQKDQRFDWSSDCQVAFDELKSLFTTAPILRHFDPDLPIRLHTDASGFAVSGILSKLHDASWHPIAYYSRKSSPAECNYDVPNREMLAVVDSMRHWRHYLEGSRHVVRVLSNHKNLEPFMTTQVLNHRQARWAELLTSYDFVLVHIHGIHNPADGPSHRLDYAHNVLVPSGSLIPSNALRLFPYRLPSPINISNVLFVNLVGVHACLASEPDLRERILCLLHSDTSVQRYRVHPKFPWSMYDGLLLHQGLIYIPEPLAWMLFANIMTDLYLSTLVSSEPVNLSCVITGFLVCKDKLSLNTSILVIYVKL